MSHVPTQYRQGDVLLIAIDDAPEKRTPIPAEGGRFILAHGEATGHAHALAAERAEFFQEPGGGRRFLLIQGGEPAALTHEEHATVPLAPGLYEVRRQREYRPESRTASWVRD